MNALASPTIAASWGGEFWYVARLDEQLRVVEQLSGFFPNRMEALPHLAWQRNRGANVRLVREAFFREITED